MDYSALLSACSLDDLTRIDIGLEGDWSPTVKTVWTRPDGRLWQSDIVRAHEILKPSLEICFVDGWIGLQCCNWDGHVHVLDENLLEMVIQEVESAVASSD